MTKHITTQIRHNKSIYNARVYLNGSQKNSTAPNMTKITNNMICIANG